jgi:hypothetical protein
VGLINNKLPVHTRAIFCCNPVKINAGREIISLEFNFIAGEMWGGCPDSYRDSENIFYFYCAFLNFICVDGERCGFVEGVGHEAKICNWEQPFGRNEERIFAREE